MRFTRHYLVNGKLLGSVQCDKVVVHDQMAEPTSYAYFCPVCANIWARAPVVNNATGETIRFQVWSICCEHHQDRVVGKSEIPGQLFLRWDKPYNDLFPREVLQYETNQAIKHLFKDEI